MLMSTAPDANAFVDLVKFELDVLDVGEPLTSQKFLRDILRRHTDAGMLTNLILVVSGGGSAASAIRSAIQAKLQFRRAPPC